MLCRRDVDVPASAPRKIGAMHSWVIHDRRPQGRTPWDRRRAAGPSAEVGRREGDLRNMPGSPSCIIQLERLPDIRVSDGRECQPRASAMESRPRPSQRLREDDDGSGAFRPPRRSDGILRRGRLRTRPRDPHELRLELRGFLHSAAASPSHLARHGVAAGGARSITARSVGSTTRECCSGESPPNASSRSLRNWRTNMALRASWPLTTSA